VFALHITSVCTHQTYNIYGHLTSLCYNVRCTLKWTYS